MQPFEQIQEYCNKISEQIRWKKAKPIIADEIKNHLCDQRDAYMVSGDDESSATQKAIVQMGDAVSVGQELDRTHRPKPQWLMIALVGILMLTGLSINGYINNAVDSHSTMGILHYTIAFGIFVFCYYIDFTMLGKHSKKIYAFVLIISIVGIMLATETVGRLSWVMGTISISLSFISLIYPLVFALFVYGMRDKGLSGIVICGLAYLPLAAILLTIPIISGFVLFTITALVVLCFAIYRGWFGVSKKQGLLLVLIPTFIVIICSVIAMLSSNTNALYRFNVLLNPAGDRSGSGYMYCMIREILAEAVLFGQGGLPQNIQDITSSLPSINADYALVYLTHQFGCIIFLCVSLLIAVFATIGIYKALKEKSVLGSLVALAIVITFIVQSVFYLADNLGYGLFSPLSLPFISYGKTALFIDAALVGFMLSVFRTGKMYKDSSPRDNKSRKGKEIFSYENGKIIINLKANHS